MQSKKISFAMIYCILLAHACTIHASEHANQQKRSWCTCLAACFGKANPHSATEMSHPAQVKATPFPSYEQAVAPDVELQQRGEQPDQCEPEKAALLKQSKTFQETIAEQERQRQVLLMACLSLASKELDHPDRADALNFRPAGFRTGFI